MVTPFASFCNLFTPWRVSLAILATLSEQAHVMLK